MSGSFCIYEYSIEKLKDLLIKHPHSSASTIKQKQHIQYFNGYFDYLKAKTILAESRYVDHDYLEDFAGYYVKSFKKIPRKCTRLHFFQERFTTDQFEKLLAGRITHLTEETLQAKYLGFIVVKPLPVTVIGRTCLKTYPNSTDTHSRHFPITRSYPVNLFGVQLSVSTLAFQEQDNVTSACATSALWSIFQGTGKLFQHAIPSPVEITKDATNNIPIESRVIPSKGLNAHQMAQAIRTLSLEPLSTNVSLLPTLKATVYAYLKGKIPLLLAFGLYDTTISPNKLIGYHAVAVAGCSLKKSYLGKYDSSGFLLKAMAIDRLYAHDDQIGPFARMEIDGIKVHHENGSQIDSLATSWRGNNGAGRIGTGRAVPDFLLIPLHNKIRIPFETVFSKVYQFDSFINTLNQHNTPPLFTGRLEWEIYLTTVNEFKSKLLQDNNGNCKNRLNTLTKRMPRFIWISKSKLNGAPFLDLLFDATGIEQGNLFVRAIEHCEDFGTEIRIIVNSGAINTFADNCDILKWFKTHR